MGGTAAAYEPYHPHLSYTLAVMCVGWLVVYLYNRHVLTNRPRLRVLLVSVAIGLPLFAELGNYAIYYLRPASDTSIGQALSRIHWSYVHPMHIDSLLAPRLLLGMAWIFGILLLISLLRFVYGSYQLRQALQIASPLSATEYAPLEERFTRIATEHNLRIPPVEVLPLPAPLAFVTGLLKPRIYITETLLDLLTADEAMAVLCHELAHIQRRDNLLNWVVRMLRDLAWFVPFSHIGWRWMVVSQDEDCDAVAVRLTRQPLALARALVKVAGAWTKTELPPMVSATAFAAARADVTTRVEQMIALLDERRLSSRWAAAGTALIAVALLMISVLPALLGS